VNYLLQDRNSLEEIAETRKTCPVYKALSRDLIGWLDANYMLIPAEFRSEINELVETAKNYADPVEVDRVYRAINQHYDEGVVEIDPLALVSAGGDPGAYVMAWVWVDNVDPSDAVDGDILGYCDVCEKVVLSGTEHDTSNGCGDLVHEDECFDDHNQNCSLCPIGG